MRTLEISPLNFALSPPAHHISPAIISKGFILPVPPWLLLPEFHGSHLSFLPHAVSS